MWTQQTTISSLIIFITASGVLFHMATILVSVLRPDSPFQTPGSELVGALCNRFLPPFTENIFLKSSAIRWLLETSTNPEYAETATAMVPLAQWPPKLDVSAMCTRFHENFMACRDKSELSQAVTYGKAMAHLCVQSVIPHSYLFLGYPDRWDGSTRLICDAFEASRLACDQFTKAEKLVDKQKHKADARTALRTMVVHGLRHRLSLPDYEGVIWRGDLQWRHTDGRTPRCEEFDWLVDYLADKVYRKIDDEIQGDALLALSAMRGLGSSAKRNTYVKVLIHCMSSTRPSRVRYAALRAISDAREELASITDNSMPHGVDSELLDELSSALLTAVRPNDDRTIDDEANLSFLCDRAFCYLTLIFTLAKTKDWHKRLSRDPHLKQCIDLIDEASPSQWSNLNLELDFYLVGICLRIDPSGKDPSLNPVQKRYGEFMSKAWGGLNCIMGAWKEGIGACIEVLPALVTATKQNLPGSENGVPSSTLQGLAREVDEVLQMLQSRDGLDGAVLSAVQGFSEDIRTSRHRRGPSSGIGTRQRRVSFVSEIIEYE
jgi:hypothetical protein